MQNLICENYVTFMQWYVDQVLFYMNWLEQVLLLTPLPSLYNKETLFIYSLTQEGSLNGLW